MHISFVTDRPFHKADKARVPTASTLGINFYCATTYNNRRLVVTSSTQSVTQPKSLRCHPSDVGFPSLSFLNSSSRRPAHKCEHIGWADTRPVICPVSRCAAMRTLGQPVACWGHIVPTRPRGEGEAKKQTRLPPTAPLRHPAAAASALKQACLQGQTILMQRREEREEKIKGNKKAGP